ncbi:AAA+-type ATPase, SpoVK/Ycf46/Vps4 family [Lachnospiraceae bacterium XBD2001]|nr:AAA+-type ATPase, SpoVK/Ycf46/Vps4 family [Lachnospiraceae bacterium XBD2001]
MGSENKSHIAYIEKLIETRAYVEACGLLQQELLKDGQDVSLLVLMGRAYYGMKDYEHSYEYFRQAKYIDSNHPAVSSGILRLSVEMPVKEHQEELFHLVKDLQDKDGFLARKDYYLGQNQISKALEEVKAARKKYPKDIDVLLADIQVRMKNHIEDAELPRLIEEGKENMPGFEICELEARFLYQMGDFAGCSKVCKRILRKYPNAEEIDEVRRLAIKANQSNPPKIHETEQERKQIHVSETVESPTVEAKVKPSEISSEEAEHQLEALIGLESVKQEIYKIKKKIEYDKARSEVLGIALENSDSYHFVFSGNPGTGKTTVARLLAEILHGAGVLEKGQLVEVERGDLVGEFQGQTALKTKKAIKSALGGVLFIDEAYSLVNGPNDDFGHEAIDALVKGVEDYRNQFVVILAGYRDEMHQLISTNIGLESRFTKFIDFPDYTEDELMEIARYMADGQHYRFSADGELAFREKISKKKYNRRFGNARTVRVLMNEAYTEKAVNFDPNEVSKEYLTILTPEDFGVELCKDSKMKAADAMDKLNRLIGLKDVKYEIRSTISIVDYLKQERTEGKTSDIALGTSLHMCFAGNPGTGKTTVARLYAEVLAALGVARNGELHEVSRSDLVGRYQGETALKTKEVCENSYGGVLFIDEAYDLVQGEHDSFGREAVATLIKQMEDNRDKMIVIFAGYSKEMEQFMEANTGIKSRISKTIVFPDYALEDLECIFYRMVDERNIILADGVRKHVNDLIAYLYERRDAKFGNAREMRNLFETIWKHMVHRVEEEQLNGDARRTVVIADIEKVFEEKGFIK